MKAITNAPSFAFALLNMLWFTGLVWAWETGLVSTLLAGDVTGISYGIFVVFCGGLFAAWHRVIDVNRFHNDSIADGPSKAKFSKDRESRIVDIMTTFSGWAATLGLIGTVVGIAMAMRGMDGLATSDTVTTDAVKSSAGHLLSGMKVAFYTTIVGVVFGLWLDTNILMLKVFTFFNRKRIEERLEDRAVNTV